jgi:hypothetical protein
LIHGPVDKPEPPRVGRATSRLRVLIKKSAFVVSVLVGFALAADTIKKFGLDLHKIAESLYEEIGQFDTGSFARDFDDASLNCVGKVFWRREPIGLFPPNFSEPVIRGCPKISFFETISNVPFAWRYAVASWNNRSGIVENTITATSILLLFLVVRYLYWLGTFRIASLWTTMLALGAIALCIVTGGQPLLEWWLNLIRAPFYTVFALSYGVLSLAAWLTAPCATVYGLCRLDKPIDVFHHYKGIREAVHSFRKLLKRP